QLNKSDQAINRAESGTEVKRTGPLFLDQKVKVLASFYAGIDRKSVDLAEIAKILQALFARLYSHSVENITRRDQHFTSNHFVLRPRIARDIDAVDVGALALIDSISEINQPIMRRRTFRNNRQINKAAAAVIISDRFGIILNGLGRVNRAFFYFHYRPQLFQGR